MRPSQSPIYILDNNIWVRLADSNAPDYATAQNAIRILRSVGAELRTVPQTLFEFWVVATRPLNRNGLGLSIEDAEAVLNRLIHLFPPLVDNTATVTHWRNLIMQYRVTGKQAHDARYIAAMQAHGLTHILTFDSDFNRYTPEGITVVHPASVVAPAQ